MREEGRGPHSRIFEVAQDVVGRLAHALRKNRGQDPKGSHPGSEAPKKIGEHHAAGPSELMAALESAQAAACEFAEIRELPLGRVAKKSGKTRRVARPRYRWLRGHPACST